MILDQVRKDGYSWLNVPLCKLIFLHSELFQSLVKMTYLTLLKQWRKWINIDSLKIYCAKDHPGNVVSSSSSKFGTKNTSDKVIRACEQHKQKSKKLNYAISYTIVKKSDNYFPLFCFLCDRGTRKVKSHTHILFLYIMMI